ncbi:hypothetical protein GCM10023156_31370 [Novipirellula rosea]|uniref:Uncharacterized protein n=1 Tax=Novipirellula rosea TaxID=1031540 RepID=A0ABP8MX32_9BACT
MSQIVAALEADAGCDSVATLESPGCEVLIVESACGVGSDPVTVAGVSVSLARGVVPAGWLGVKFLSLNSVGGNAVFECSSPFERSSAALTGERLTSCVAFCETVM